MIFTIPFFYSDEGEIGFNQNIDCSLLNENTCLVEGDPEQSCHSQEARVGAGIVSIGSWLYVIRTGKPDDLLILEDDKQLTSLECIYVKSHINILYGKKSRFLCCGIQVPFIIEQRFPTSGIVCETLRNTKIVSLFSFKLFVCIENDSWCYVRYLAENQYTVNRFFP